MNAFAAEQGLGAEGDRLGSRRQAWLAQAGSDSAAQMRWGVRGKSRWSTPSQPMASSTAFCTAGVAPIVPHSPMPFAPRGLSGVGVCWLMTSNDGSSRAEGRQVQVQLSASIATRRGLRRLAPGPCRPTHVDIFDSTPS